MTRRTRSITLAGTAALFLAGLIAPSAQGAQAPFAGPSSDAVAAADAPRVTVTTDAARYAPGKAVKVTVNVANEQSRPLLGHRLRLTARHLDDTAGRQTTAVQPLAAGKSGERTFTWRPPKMDFTGYLLQVDLLDVRGRTVGTGYSAVDVSSDPSRFVRYGFVSAYNQNVDPKAVAQYLKDHHITDVQFYDWHWKHHVPLAGSVAEPAAEWQDLAGRQTLRTTVSALIDEVHQNNGRALDYNLLFGADDDYLEDGSGAELEWGLFKDKTCTDQDSHGPLPSSWPVQRIYLFDPANPEWQDYIAAKENDTYKVYPFDGFQADQLGNRGVRYTCDGQEVNLPDRYSSFLSAFAEKTGKSVTFNAVDQYGQDQVAANPSLDYLYAETWGHESWGKHQTYKSLQDTIEHNWAAGGHKNSVLAAYVNKPLSDGAKREFNTPGVLTANAVIFASGGVHNELGDVEHMLGSEYYPNTTLSMSAELKESIGHYYDFLVAYQNLLRDQDVQPAESRTESVSVPTSTDGKGDTVWTFARTKGGTEVLHFVNLLGNTDTNWVDKQGARAKPTAQQDVKVKHYYQGAQPREVNFASPDVDGGRARQLDFTQGSDNKGSYVEFTLPSLNYWDMVWVD
ncbi:glycoside hydrolase family 66 protein [Streptomyces pathocidini]|uniref:Glycoside hydrolase family 66 protein n=1 Tax=Streptomyces pathocidini TaxID=1650571 RepID=A0ABW7UKD2_9ACTN|nr:glycoside hydrolase family 66 protein [Streptomyces pathocidini]